MALQVDQPLHPESRCRLKVDCLQTSRQTHSLFNKIIGCHHNARVKELAMSINIAVKSSLTH